MYEFVIEPGAKARHYWRDLWRYRELFFTLAWRDISVRYKQTVVGIAWAVLQPLVTMVVMILGHIYIGTLGMEGAFDAMGTGMVDRNWAIEHHGLWVEEVEARGRGVTGGGAVAPAE